MWHVAACQSGVSVRGPHPYGALRVAVWSDNGLSSRHARVRLSRTLIPWAPGVFCATARPPQERKVCTIAKSEGPRVNGEITARSCRLIGVDGSQLGLFGVLDARRIAERQNLDLVEIAPNADPPVCKVMDFGKFKYEQAIKAKQARKNQAKVEIKEMKFRPKIDTGDYETKKGHVVRFLKKGARVKITIMFRGREMAHPDQGLNVLERLANDLKDYATVESQPKMEGRNMHMLVAPIRGAFDEKEEPVDEQDKPVSEQDKKEN